MSRKALIVSLMMVLFLFACSGATLFEAPTPTALPQPTDYPSDIATPVPGAEAATTDEASQPTGATEAVTGARGAAQAPGAGGTGGDNATATTSGTGGSSASGGTGGTGGTGGSTSATQAPTSTAPQPSTPPPDLTPIIADNAPNVVLLKEVKISTGFVAISPQSDVMASAEGSSVVLYTMPWLTSPVKLDGHTGKVNAITWSPDGTQLASASDDGSLRVWDATEGKQVSKFDVDSSGVSTAAWSPDGITIAAGTKNGAVKLIDAQDGKSTITIKASSGSQISAISWSTDATQLVTASYADANKQGEIQLWDTTTGQALMDKPLQDYLAPGPTGVAWSPTDNTVAWVDNKAGGSAALWTVDDDNRTSVMLKDMTKVDSIAWGPNGDVVATAGSDHTIRIFDAFAGASLVQLQGHNDTVHTVAWSPDSTYIISASVDGAIRVWGVPQK